MNIVCVLGAYFGRYSQDNGYTYAYFPVKSPSGSIKAHFAYKDSQLVFVDESDTVHIIKYV